MDEVRKLLAKRDTDDSRCQFSNGRLVKVAAIGGCQAKVVLTEIGSGYKVGGALRLDDSWRPFPVQVSDAQLDVFNSLQRPPERSALAVAIAEAEARARVFLK